jgi:predicted permease
VLAILGLGIGMAVAMFATFHTVLIRRLPVRDQERIAVLWPYNTPSVELSVFASDVPEIRRASRTMRDIAGVAHWGTSKQPFLDGDRTLTLGHSDVTSNYFDVLGAKPVLGRLLRSEDDVPGASPAMVLSYATWQSQFAGSPTVLGRRIMWPYTRMVYTVVGVAPPGLDYPLGVGCWTPLERTDSRQVLAVARLAPGVSIGAARDEFLSAARRVKPTFDLTGATAEPFTTAVVGDVRPVLTALTAAVALLLLIACVNVGSLFFVRAASRAHELAVRRALGASYGDLVRQLVVESAVVALAGGALGIACAQVLVRTLVSFAPRQLPRLDDIQLHANLVSVTLGVTTLAVLLFGVIPALVSARVNLASPLSLNARSGAETRHRRRIRDWLVASQVALALVMLAGAGLLTRSLRRLEQLDLAYRADHLSIAWVAWNAPKYNSTQRMREWGDQVQQHMRSIAGVSAVTPVLIPPFLGTNFWHVPVEAEVQAAASGEGVIDVPVESVNGQYLQTFDTRLVRGRGILDTDREGAPNVTVISQSVAQRLWPGQDPIGKRLRVAPSMTRGVGSTAEPWRTVVGVVPDTRFRTLRSTSPMMYLPWRQFAGWQGGFAVRSSGGVPTLTAPIRRALKEVDPTLVLAELRSMDDLLGEPLAQPRLTTLLLAAFGVVALVLATVGLYGVMASAVRERTREIGIRAALGATPARIRNTMLRQAIVVAGGGACVGLAAALATTRLLRSLLFEVSPTDPITLGAVSVLLMVVALFAAYLPVRRATRIDPIHALRAD